ncbi:MAG: ABC transporter ATP-binding protein [Alphaproteobacteria bacterium]
MSPLVIECVSKSYGRHVVLDDVSFQLEPGEIFGLIGLNGAGKTTLIKILLDLARADRGQVLIFDEPSTKVQARRKLSYLPEKFSPSRYLHGVEYLRFSLAYYGRAYDSQAAQSMAAALDLDPDVLARRVGSYSKGMGQKLGLAGAFLIDQPLIILDEPMSGLDPRARIRLKEELLRQKRAGKTIFFSSHILADIDEICDRIGIIHDAKLRYIGTARDFKPTYQEVSLERAFLKVLELPTAAA